MARKMTNDEYKSFLSYGTRTGKLATVKKDGLPHVVPIWFVLDNDSILFTTGEKSIKGLNIKRHPYVAFTVDEDKPMYSFILVEGKANILHPSAEELLKWTTRIARRYMGDKLADQYGKRNAAIDELLVEIIPTKIIAQRDVAE